MSKLHFNYSMKLYYSEPVNPCHFTIKCIPMDNSRQRLKKINIQMDPRANYSHGTDAFGNEKIIGSLRIPHDHYFLNVDGVIEVDKDSYEEAIDYQTSIYKYPFGKTIPGASIRSYFEKIRQEISNSNIENDYDKATYVMHELHSDFSYDTTSTQVETSAEAAMEMRRGVCQDYAHIYVSLMRLFGIPARYIAGLVIGEGQSHAWVELMLNGKWIGIDPTNDVIVDENYIKLGHGRDAGDCKINLGIMYGGGDQRQEIEVKVWKE